LLLVKTAKLAGSSSDSNSEFQDLKTRIWRQCRSSGEYLLKVSLLNVPDQVLLTIIGQHYAAKNFYGIKFLGRYIEIYPRKSIIGKVITESVQYKKQKIYLLLCKAIKGISKFIQFSLTDIPYLFDNELERTLRKL
jgi:hypothetical protein